MKKALALLLAFVLLASLVACGGAAGPSNDGSETNTSDAENSEETTQADKPSSDLDAAEVGGMVELAGLNWRVLAIEDGKALIISDLVLEERAYHNEYGEITWAECDLRAYLNGSFYENTFSAEEKARIVETELTTNDSPLYGAPGGAATTDKVFLLSLEEVVEYFGDSGQLATIIAGNYDPEDDLPETARYISDDYDEARKAQSTYSAVAESWWLRTPGLRATYVSYINSYGGNISLAGGDANSPHGSKGMRPALWISLG
jgi:predicted small lipoprotein YifL